MTKICLRTCQNILLVTLEIIKCRMHVQNCIFEICQTPNTSLFTLFTFGRITAHYNSCVTFMNTMLKNFRRLLAAVGFGVVSGGGVEEEEEMVMMGSGGEGSVMAGNLATSHNTSHDIDTREESVGGGGREESRDMFEETNDEEEVEEAEDVNLVDLEEEDVKA